MQGQLRVRVLHAALNEPLRCHADQTLKSADGYDAVFARLHDFGLPTQDT